MGAVTSIEREPLVTAKEVAKHLQISEGTVLKRARKGEIPAIRVGIGTRLWRFRISEVDQWLEDLQQPGRTA